MTHRRGARSQSVVTAGLAPFCQGPSGWSSSWGHTWKTAVSQMREYRIKCDTGCVGRSLLPLPPTSNPQYVACVVTQPPASRPGCHTGDVSVMRTAPGRATWMLRAWWLVLSLLDMNCIEKRLCLLGNFQYPCPAFRYLRLLIQN